jgi:hypothetical protein
MNKPNLRTNYSTVIPWKSIGIFKLGVSYDTIPEKNQNWVVIGLQGLPLTFLKPIQ